MIPGADLRPPHACTHMHAHSLSHTQVCSHTFKHTYATGVCKRVGKEKISNTDFHDYFISYQKNTAGISDAQEE